MEVRVCEKLGHVEVKWIGRFSTEKALCSFAEALNCSTGGMILDVRGADLNIPVREIWSASRRVSHLLGDKIWRGAVVAPDRLSYGQMRVFVAVLGTAGEDMLVCSTEHEALVAVGANTEPVLTSSEGHHPHAVEPAIPREVFH